MSVLCLAACGILNYPEYVRQLLTVAIVNLPQWRAECAQGRESGACCGRLYGEQNMRTDTSRARRGCVNKEQSMAWPPQQGVNDTAAASTASNHVVNLLAPSGRRDDASIGHDGDIMTVCDSGQTCTRTSENKGPHFGIPMRDICLIQKNCLR